MFSLNQITKAFCMLAVAALFAIAPRLPATAAETLSRDQLVALQLEAEAAFDRGVKLQPTDPVSAKDAFAEAAQKYQLLADSHSPSGPLFFNLANAYLQSGQVGPAIANYWRAEKWRPGDERVAAGLHAARTLAGTPSDVPAADLSTNVKQWNQAIPLGARIWAGTAAWILVWTIFALALRWPNRRWRLAWIPALVVSLLAAASIGYQRYSSRGNSHGVVTADEAIVRHGNGAGFAPQFSQPLPAGTEFAVKDRRGQWSKIVLPDGRSGWINDQDAAVIE
ncbi:MAG: hypothetical protein IT427_14460 [Pirellulales bacterium]|nr:hypothetical protein [Pirellulales bacterium]